MNNIQKLSVAVFLSVFFAVVARGQTLNVGAPLSAGASSNFYPVAYGIEVAGCDKQVADVTAMNAIPAVARREGMRVWLINSQVEYRLIGGTNNANWVLQTVNPTQPSSITNVGYLDTNTTARFARDTAAVYGVSPTPGMVFDLWPTLGYSVNESNITACLDFMDTNGLVKLGWKAFCVDDAWQSTNGRIAGHLTWDTNKFPSGLPAIVAYAHSKGIKMYIYCEANLFTSVDAALGGLGLYQGSLTNLEGDVRDFVTWGFDGLAADKPSDWSAGANAANAYWSARFGAAFVAVSTNKQPYMRCNGWTTNYDFSAAAAFCNDFQVTDALYHDLTAEGQGVNGTWTNYMYDIFRCGIINPTITGPGHFQKLDWFPQSIGGFTFASGGAASMYAMLSSPLWPGASGNDFASYQPGGVRFSYLTNVDFLSINQDPLGRKARPIIYPGIVSPQVWLKNLDSGNLALCFLNGSTATTNLIGITTEMIGLQPGQTVSFKNVWAQTNGTFTGSYSNLVAPIDSSLFILYVGSQGSGGTATNVYKTNVVDYLGFNKPATIVGLGDSIMQGFWTPGADFVDIMPQFWPQSTVATNAGGSGDTAVGMNGRYATDVTPWWGAGTKILLVEGGINDVYQGASAATIFNALSNICYKGKQDGALVGLCTVPNSWDTWTNINKQLVQMQVNRALRNSTNMYDRLIDVNALMGNHWYDLCVTNDVPGASPWGLGVHWTTNTHRWIAGYVANLFAAPAGTYVPVPKISRAIETEQITILNQESTLPTAHGMIPSLHLFGSTNQLIFDQAQSTAMISDRGTTELGFYVKNSGANLSVSDRLMNITTAGITSSVPVVAPSFIGSGASFPAAYFPGDIPVYNGSSWVTIPFGDFYGATNANTASAVTIARVYIPSNSIANIFVRVLATGTSASGAVSNRFSQYLQSTWTNAFGTNIGQLGTGVTNYMVASTGGSNYTVTFSASTPTNILIQGTAPAGETIQWGARGWAGFETNAVVGGGVASLSPTNTGDANIAAKIWWRAADIGTNNGGATSIIPDYSGNGFDGTNSFASSAWPVRHTSGWNGLDTAWFTNTASSGTHTRTLGWTNPTPNEYFIVCAITNVIGSGAGTGQKLLLDSADSAGRNAILLETNSALGGLLLVTSGGVVVTNAICITNKWWVIDALYNGDASSTIFTNNVTGVAANNGTHICKGLTFGTINSFAVGYGSIFEFGELFAFHTNLPTATRSNMWYYCTNKWAIVP